MEPQQRRQTKTTYEDYFYSGGTAAEVMAFARGAPATYVAPVQPSLRKDSTISASPDKVTSVLGELVHALIQEVVAPILRAPSREACLRTLGAKWHIYSETLSALHVLVARTSSEERARALAEESTRTAAVELVDAARALSGPTGEDEVHFCYETYSSALRLVDSFAQMPAPSSEDLGRDHALCRSFGIGAKLHILGAMLLALAADTRPSPAGIEFAFELLRAGALQAYSSVREAYDLRRPKDDAEVDEDSSFYDPLLDVSTAG